MRFLRRVRKKEPYSKDVPEGGRPVSLLSAESVREKLQSLSGWKLENKEIVRHFEFPDFKAAIEFVSAVAEKAESAMHHPDIDIRYNKVRLALTSHDAGGLTERDIKMARTLNSL
jgi:4a-hydroxytetrahydrobiopterin dehydratase